MTSRKYLHWRYYLKRILMSQLGYDDTPLISNQPYKVHDSLRLQPRVVTPGAQTSLGAPSDAIILFDGRDLSGWVGAQGESAARPATPCCATTCRRTA
jgi:hypothetical protein